MKKPRLNIELIGQVLKTTLPDKNPSLVGHTADVGMLLAAYSNYHNCYVPKHNNDSFHTLEIMDGGSLLSHKRILADRTIESPLRGDKVSICRAYATYFLDPRHQIQGLSFTLLTLHFWLKSSLSRNLIPFHEKSDTYNFWYYRGRKALRPYENLYLYQAFSKMVSSIVGCV